MTLRQEMLKRSLERGLEVCEPEGFLSYVVHDRDLILNLREFLRIHGIYSTVRDAIWTNRSTLSLLEFDTVPDGLRELISEFCLKVAEEAEL